MESAESPPPLNNYWKRPEYPPSEMKPLEPVIPDYRCPWPSPNLPPRRRINRWWHRQSTHISHLCQDTLEVVFSHLRNAADKGRAAQVCWAWRNAAYSASVWRGVEAHLRLDEQSDDVPWSVLRRRRICAVRVMSTNWRGMQDLMRQLPLTTAVSFQCGAMVVEEGLLNVASRSRLLESLDLTGCNLTDLSLHWIAGGLRQLKRLDLTQCMLITDVGIKYLAIFNRELEVLVLASCGDGITDLSLGYISSCMRKLHSINISGCHKISGYGLRYLAYMPNLKTLILSNRQDVGGHALAHLVTGGSMVHSLRLENCGIVKNSGLFCLGKLVGLRELCLARCQIGDVGLAYLARAECRVEVLDLSFCDSITDIGLGYLSALTSLRRLDLTGCRRVSSGGLVFLRRTQLSHLTLKDCIMVGRGALVRMAATLFGLRTLCLDQAHVNDVGLVLAACNLQQLETLVVSGRDRMVDIKKIRASPDIVLLVSTLPVWSTPTSVPNLADASRSTNPPVSRLSPQVLALIFTQLGVTDRGRAAQVCTSWRDACYHPSVWCHTEIRLRLVSQSRQSQAQSVPWSSLANRGVRRVRAFSRNLWGLRHLVNGLPDLRSLSLPVHLHQTNLLTRFFSMKLPQLTELRLEYCDTIHDECVQLIADHLVNLVCLEMPGAILITDASMLAIAGLTRLRRLAITQCRSITDVGVAYLGTRTGNVPLTSLMIRNANHLTDQSLVHLSIHLRSLECLDFGGCLKISLFTDPPVGTTAVAKQNRNLVTKSVVRDDCVSLLTELRHLCLSGCIGIGDSGLVQLVNSKVVVLDLEACVSITDAGLAHLARMTALRRLDLSFNDRISNVGLTALAGGEGGTSQLHALNVRCCDCLSARTLLGIARGFPHLRSLTLDQRHLSDAGLHLAGANLGHQLHTLRVGGFNRINEIRNVRLHVMLYAIGVPRYINCL